MTIDTDLDVPRGHLENLPAERGLLGILLLSGQGGNDTTVAELAARVQPSDFSDPRHERIFDQIVTLSTSGNPTDPVAVATALGSWVHQLPGGAVYLTDMLAASPVPASADYYVDLVQDAATRRRLNAAGIKVQQLANTDGNINEIVDRARAATEAATREATTSGVTTLAAVLPRMVDLAQFGRARGLETPWPAVNRFITGLTPGRFVVVGARPGVGKSVFGTNLALHIAHRHAQPVHIASLEMPAVEVAQRIMACHARVDLSKLDQAAVDERSWGKLDPAVAEAMTFPITIVEEPEQTITAIRSGLRHTIATHGHVPLVVVDYIQLIQARDRRVNRSEQIGEITRDLKIIAREFNTCVVAMSQVNRAGAERHEPTLSDLRESGSIEADADVVILLHHPDADPDRIPPLQAHVAKNRGGPTGRADLALQGHYARITGYSALDEQKYLS